MNQRVFCVAGVGGADQLIVAKANYKEKEYNKVRRKVITGRNRRKGDKDESKDGKTCGGSSFWALISVTCLFQCNLFLVKSYVETLTAVYYIKQYLKKLNNILKIFFLACNKKYVFV